jgi:hypothetical protein
MVMAKQRILALVSEPVSGETLEHALQGRAIAGHANDGGVVDIPARIDRAHG